MRKSFLCSLCVLLALALAAPAVAEPAALTCGVRDIQVFGNLVLDLAPAALAEAGYEYGDVLSLTVDGTEYQVPFCTNYSDVDVNETVLRDSEGVLTLAINMGDFATQNGIAAKVSTGEDAFAWQVSGGREIGDLQVSIVLAVKGGYRDEYLSRQLFSTNAREDYASDAVFANFRAVAGGALGENALFRSSSPLNNDLGRAAYANALLAESGVRTVVNLSDSREQIEAFAAQEGFDSAEYMALYDAGQVIALQMGVDFTTDDFKARLGRGLQFMATQEGPYLVHCSEGKDRAGFVCALLSCFMGANYEAAIDDYMTSFENYFHLTEGSEQYEAVKNSNIVPMLETIAGVEAGADLRAIDLVAAAREYILSTGLSTEEVDALYANLAKDYSAEF